MLFGIINPWLKSDDYKSSPATANSKAYPKQQDDDCKSAPAVAIFWHIPKMRVSNQLLANLLFFNVLIISKSSY
jgi:hypothetical protein